MVLALGDDNMVDEFDVERPADAPQEVGDANIAVARGRVTAWMIMDQQDSRRVQFERAPENRAGIKCQLPNRAMLHLLVGDESARRVQKQHAKNFLGQRPHRGLEIFDQFRAGGFDHATEQFGAHGFEAGLARGKQKAYDRTLFPEDPRERLG
ncbi:hypothetical protein OVY29_14995 [Sphingopyxis sp. SE2]|nr:hypothetical protein [Sphingopyxis sp. SE2]MDR7181688.1 hypothetical protein [Sphingopyxis sp. BE249]MDT7529966.1 hypothetical protein [Sphingopyxis sp. SE2]